MEELTLFKLSSNKMTEQITTMPDDEDDWYTDNDDNDHNSIDLYGDDGSGGPLRDGAVLYTDPAAKIYNVDISYTNRFWPWDVYIRFKLPVTPMAEEPVTVARPAARPFSDWGFPLPVQPPSPYKHFTNHFDLYNENHRQRLIADNHPDVLLAVALVAADEHPEFVTALTNRSINQLPTWLRKELEDYLYGTDPLFKSNILKLLRNNGLSGNLRASHKTARVGRNRDEDEGVEVDNNDLNDDYDNDNDDNDVVEDPISLFGLAVRRNEFEMAGACLQQPNFVPDKADVNRVDSLRATVNRLVMITAAAVSRNPH